MLAETLELCACLSAPIQNAIVHERALETNRTQLALLEGAKALSGMHDEGTHVLSACIRTPSHI